MRSRERTNYLGAAWVKNNPPTPMSPFGERCADMVGAWMRGIYHIAAAVEEADWSQPYIVVLHVVTDLSTYDSDALTRLVILAHDRAIRVQIEPDGRALKLSFTPRTRPGDLYRGHQTIEAAIADVRREHGEPLAEVAANG